MLVVDLPDENGGSKTMVLGLAIPTAWGGGQVKGLRLRGVGVWIFGGMGMEWLRGAYYCPK